MPEIRTINGINKKIKEGNATVVTAEKMISIAEEKGVKAAAKEVDVVTTGTFGAMCSSGAFLNFGHSDPPIKMEHLYLNDVEAYHGNAAVDCYIGATKMSRKFPFKYGGGHVIEDLVSNKSIDVKASAYGTDCYPRKNLDTTITIADLNQIILCNPRNCYQRYNAAVNRTDQTLYTYMGKLLPDMGNITYSGAGSLNPLMNDPTYQTIGVGTRIFLGGGIGYVYSEGTQHSPVTGFGTIMVGGDLKQMNSKYLRGASFERYGTTLYVGIGIPIPILNEDLAKTTATKDDEIFTSLVDYGIPRRKRPIVREVSYAELKSGRVEVDGRSIPTGSLSSLKVAQEVAYKLKTWIENGDFLLTQPAERLSSTRVFHPMREERKITRLKEVTKPAIVCKPDDDLKHLSKSLIKNNVNHIVVLDHETLVGIVSSFDVAKAVAKDKTQVADVMTEKVVIADPEDPVSVAARILETHDISALPIVDKQGKVHGIVTAEDLSRLIARGVE